MRNLLVLTIEPCLQEQAGGDHINLAPHLLLVEALLAQNALGLLRGQALVLKLQRKIEFVGNLLRTAATRSAWGPGSPAIVKGRPLTRISGS